VDEKIQDGNTAAANVHNNSVTPQNHAESNHKELNNILINRIADTTNLTPSDSLKLLTIASDCPSYGGLAVFQARVLYSQLYQENVNFTDDCPELAGAKISNFSYAKGTSIKVYPNPSRGEIFVEMDGETVLINFELYTVDGKLVKSRVIYKQNFAQQIELNDLETGVYFYKLKRNNELLVSDKIVLINEH
jgi:hypothetical protein